MKMFLLAVILLLFLLEADAPPRASAAGAVSVTRTRSFQAGTAASFRDAYVNSNSNTFNYGVTTTMNVKSSSTTSCASNTLARSCSHALIWFDVSIIPASLTMSAASVDLTATVGTVTRNHGLHPITESWTEGTGNGSATLDGATWNTRDGATAWTTAGGSAGAVSQTVATGTTTGVKTFADVAALRTDVNGWVSNSANNFGWLVKDQAEATGTSVTWSYATKENATAANRPTLTVTYTGSPPWDSYNSACATGTETFDASPNNVVCAKGTGFSTSTTYDIAYYDGAGAKVIEESAVTATGGALQSASYTISTCCASSTEGTWHVVAFESAATPPATYSAIVQNTDLVVADDTFTVNAPAIPELSTVLAAIGMGAAAAAAYLWMRRRMGYVTA